MFDGTVEDGLPKYGTTNPQKRLIQKNHTKKSISGASTRLNIMLEQRTMYLSLGQ